MIWHGRQNRGWLAWAALAWLATAAVAQEVAKPLRAPCDDATYETYKALYADPQDAPLNAKVVNTADEGGTKVEELEFDSTNGERVTGLLMLPPSQGKLPIILALHGLGGSKDDFRQAAQLLAAFGVEIGILALDAPLHGQRKKEGGDLLGDPSKLKQAFVQAVVDYRRAIDYLATRTEVNPDRIGVAGLSMGAMMGTILTAVEPRVKTSVLAVGGADWVALIEDSTVDPIKALRAKAPGMQWELLRPVVDAIDPVHYASRFGDRPVLLMNASKDEIIPKRCADTLHAAATGKPCEKQWFEAGHMLPPEQVATRLLTWFQQYL